MPWRPHAAPPCCWWVSSTATNLQVLDRINVVLVPRANPDGADAGTPETAAGVDMVSDHLVLSTPEARALAELVREYRPVLVLDAREFPAAGALRDALGAEPSYDALLQYGTAANVPDFITKAAREWYYEPMAASLKSEHLRSDWFFGRWRVRALRASPAAASCPTRCAMSAASKMPWASRWRAAASAWDAPRSSAACTRR